MTYKRYIINCGFMMLALCPIAILGLSLSPLAITALGLIQLAIVLVIYVTVKNYINNLCNLNILAERKIKQMRHDARSTLSGIKHLSTLILTKIEDNQLRHMHELMIKSADELISASETSE